MKVRSKFLPDMLEGPLDLLLQSLVSKAKLKLYDIEITFRSFE